MELDGLKTFSASKHAERNNLGEHVTKWLAEQRQLHPQFRVLDLIITQSSDSEFHCVTIAVLYKWGSTLG